VQLKEEPPVVEPEEKVFEVLRVDEAELEAELEEIKRNAAEIHRISRQGKPQLLFEHFEPDIPTLSHQSAVTRQEVKEIVPEEKTSVNDHLKEQKVEVSEKLADSPIKDLRKAIGINDRFLYLHELFRGDEAMYERSIKTINSFSIWPEAEYWIRRELKTKLGWNDQDETVKQFDKLVQKRFG
jgi:thiamine kinase-like enzyme